MDIFWLDEEGCCDPARVGGKAAQLARLTAAYSVPPGFCLLGCEPPDCGPLTLGAIVFEGAAPVKMGDAQLERLSAAYAQLGRRCGTVPLPVAVRSSAVDEDGHAASFAGQHESYLNVVGLDAVAAAVTRCLASAHSPRALAYRRAHGLDVAGNVAVLVQQLVVADVSAVVFSIDPRTGERDHVVINATWGLGESLVGGTVVPDLYVLRRQDLAFVEQHLADKTCMTVALSEPGGTTREVPVPGPMRREACLAPQQVVELAHLARAIEASQGWPVDLECAYRGGQLYLLQCRPVTAAGARHATAATPFLPPGITHRAVVSGGPRRLCLLTPS